MRDRKELRSPSEVAQVLGVGTLVHGPISRGASARVRTPAFRHGFLDLDWAPQRPRMNARTARAVEVVAWSPGLLVRCRECDQLFGVGYHEDGSPPSDWWRCLRGDCPNGVSGCRYPPSERRTVAWTGEVRRVDAGVAPDLAKEQADALVRLMQALGEAEEDECRR
jgi:hypothetical protein